MNAIEPENVTIPAGDNAKSPIAPIAPPVIPKNSVEEFLSHTWIFFKNN